MLTSQNVSPVKMFAEETRRYGTLVTQIYSKSDVLVLNGHNCGLRVLNNALHVRQGTVLGEEKESIVYYRGTAPIKKTIILARAGNITLESL